MRWSPAGGLAQYAERSLDIQYYLYHTDTSGYLLTQVILDAADRGVRVRVLLDDMDLGGRDREMVTLNQHPNIEIRSFNPFIRGQWRLGQMLTRFGSVTRRMHNKAFIADNQFAILGGRNIGDTYFGADPDNAFGDLDVVLVGASVAEVSKSFDLYWNSELSYPVELLSGKTPREEDLEVGRIKLAEFVEAQQGSKYARALRASDLVKQAEAGEVEYYWGTAQVLYDDPMKLASDRSEADLHLSPQLAPYMQAIEHELIVVSPYFVPGKEGVAFFEKLRERGVAVKIVTNSLSSNDVPIVHAGYKKYRKALLRAGVELYEVDKTSIQRWSDEHAASVTEALPPAHRAELSLHAKYFILDRQQAFIGSLNLDPRSVVENTEIGTLIESPELAAYLADELAEIIDAIAFRLSLEGSRLRWECGKDGELQVFTKEPYTSWWDRFTVNCMSILPIESQL